MPLVIAQRCARCHQMKPRTDFPSHVVGKTLSGKPRRTWSSYCAACHQQDPSLASGVAPKEPSLETEPG